MTISRHSAPPPDLRIIRVDQVLPHETHDSQRSRPLVEKLRVADVMINPPIVAPLGAVQYVILDGANRCQVFNELEYPHILVQVSSYDSGYVELDNWQHIISDWNAGEFRSQLERLEDVILCEGQEADAIAHIMFRNGDMLAVCAPVRATHERNAVLREVVDVYQKQATLNRTAITESEEIWPLFPNAIAVVIFPRYKPADIIAAAKYKAYIPPGISRHIVHGRALRVNYPMDELRDPEKKLADKNAELQAWLQQKFAQRQIRYYSEATYQFDE